MPTKPCSTSAVVTRFQALISSKGVDYAKTLLLLYVVLTRSLKAWRHLRARGVIGTGKDFWQWLAQQALLLTLRLPHLRAKVDSELTKARNDLEAKLIPTGPSVVRRLSLPEKGLTKEEVIKELEKMDEECGYKEGDTWRHGKVSGAVYHGGDELSELLATTQARYLLSNPLHPEVFPSVRKMEAEVVAMCLKLFNAPSTGAGVTTSGGTESIIMSIRAHAMWARAVKGITEPEIIIPASAHAAFDKGASYFGIKVHTIPVDPVTRQVDVKRVKRAINGNTIMLVASVINFPDGNADPVSQLSILALQYNLGLHVDSCLGSFVVPFLKEAGFDTKGEVWDFRVPGVTSISCDTHKYGFAPKGNSVIMYRTSNLRSYQYYVNPTWMGGVYASPSFAGSRPGALIAGTWAAMQFMGRDGYLASCKALVTAARTIVKAIKDDIPELYVLGNPPASVVAFGSKHPKVSAHQVGDNMSKRGWHLNAITNPEAVHIAVTRLTVPVVDTFIADLKDSVREARENPLEKGTMVAVYGLGSSSAVGPTIVGQLATMFLDTLYKA